jgi:hypothetical protein
MQEVFGFVKENLSGAQRSSSQIVIVIRYVSGSYP